MKKLVLLLTALLALVVFGCGKPEDKLIGRWVSEKTASTLEFYPNRSGAISLKFPSGLPSQVPFTWEMEKEGAFKVTMRMPGTPELRTGKGVLVNEGQLVLEDDPFRKVK